MYYRKTALLKWPRGGCPCGLVSIYPDEHFFGDAKKSANLMLGHTTLCRLCDRRVPQHVRDYLGTKLRIFMDTPECFVDLFDRFAVELDHCCRRQSDSLPSSHVREQSRRNSDCWLSLLGFDGASRPPIKHAGVEVDPTATVTEDSDGFFAWPERFALSYQLARRTLDRIGPHLEAVHSIGLSIQNLAVTSALNSAVESAPAKHRDRFNRLWG